MAAIASNECRRRMGRGLDFQTATLVALVMTTAATSAEVLDNDNADDCLASGTGTGVEALTSGTGYSRQTLTSVTVTRDDVGDEITLDADPISLASLDLDAAQVVQILVLLQTGGSVDTSADPVLFSFESTAFPLTTNGSPVTFNFAAAGIATW